MNSSEQLYLATREEWRSWLTSHYDSSTGIWLVYYKKGSGKPRIPYDDAVEEALCFGWIDSLVKTLDEHRYMQKYSPRRKNSNWSELNRNRCRQQIADGMMTPAGLRSIEIAIKTGRWDPPMTEINADEIPPVLETALRAKPNAWKHFISFAPSYRTKYIQWFITAKREQTRMTRLKEIVRRSSMNEKPGML